MLVKMHVMEKTAVAAQGARGERKDDGRKERRKKKGTLLLS